MERPTLMVLLLGPLIVIAAVISAPAQEPNAVSEFDPGIGITFDLTKRTRLEFFTGKEKSEELATSKTKVNAGVSFRMKPLFKIFRDELDSDKQHVLVIGAAYEFSRASEPEATMHEHKIMLDGTVRYAFAYGLLVSDRNRFEFRWVSGDYHFRYRNRVMLERPFNKKLKFTPYGAVEAIWRLVTHHSVVVRADIPVAYVVPPK